MANETLIANGTAKTLEASGLALANNAIVAVTTIYDRSVDGGNYMDGRFVFSGAFAVAPVENSPLDIYGAAQDISTTNDEQAPETTYKPRYFASLTLNNVITTQYIESAVVRRVPKKFLASLHNNGSGQSLAAGWTLAFIPETFGTV